MNVRPICKCCVVSALVILGWSFGLDRAIFAQPGQADVEEGVEVLTRGPVHEAFAETVTFDPEPGIVVPKAPPAAIEELPPDQKPEGANVAWIPGYWGWDDERSDFLWVSGIWRALPPGRQWVPGYWGKSGQGFQWTSGYWADAKTSEVEYLPEPPETVEAGPNIAAPSADSTWLPGSWVWQQEPLCLASRFLGDRAAELGVGPRPLRVGPSRLRLRQRLLGLLDRPSRRAVCAGLFRSRRLRAAGLLLLAYDGDRPGCVRQPSLLASALPTLLLRRLLRRQLPERRVPPLVLVPIQPLWLRSDLRAPALAVSAGPAMGAPPANRLPAPSRPGGRPTTAYVGGPESSQHDEE